MPVRRVGTVIRLRPEHEQVYRELHAAVWPDVLAQIARSNIRNYTIWLDLEVLLRTIPVVVLGKGAY